MSYVDELKKGPYPSVIKELEKSRYILPMYTEALNPEEYRTLFGFGGYISIPGLGAGVAVRVTKRPELLKESAYIRMLDPGAGFYTTDALRKLCDIADKYGMGILHMNANTGTFEIKGIEMKCVYEMVAEINEEVRMDVGSTGDDIRNIESCMGATLCEWDLIDAPRIRDVMGREMLEDQQFPRFPHKFKIKISGCPNDCVRAIQKADLAIVGVFKDLPIINESELHEWVEAGGNPANLVKICPAGALSVEDGKLNIDSEACFRCFACINKCPAISPGKDRGVAILVGGKSGNRGRYGNQPAKAIIPFMKVTPPKYSGLIDLIYRIVDVWDEHGRRKERFGDFIIRYGIGKFLKELDIEITPQILGVPKSTAHIYYL